MFPTDFEAIYDCELCRGNRKRRTRLGCRKRRRESIAEYECPICEGKNDDCRYHKPNERIEFHRCPKTYITRDAARLVPYFFDWIRNPQSFAWPDGRGRIYQPVKLVKSFEILLRYYIELKPKEDPDGR